MADELPPGTGQSLPQEPAISATPATDTQQLLKDLDADPYDEDQVSKIL